MPIIGLENTKITKDDRGFIKVNEKQQTNDPALYAIGDVAGGVLLAHKATREGKVAVDAIIGEYESLDKYIIPAVVFTDPEIAWCGLTETEAKEKGITVKVARFPWGASGRALTLRSPGRRDQTDYRSRDRTGTGRGDYRPGRGRTD